MFRAANHKVLHRHTLTCLASAALLAISLAAPARSAEFEASTDLSSLDGTTGFRVDGAALSDYSGIALSRAGDFNGDGFEDLLTGASHADAGVYGTDAGAAYVVFGKASPVASSLGLQTIDGTNGVKITGAAMNNFAGFSVAAAGDVNGDGYDDVIVGAYRADSMASGHGAAYVVFGKPTGPGEVVLSALAPAQGFKINGVVAQDLAGFSVGGGGDVNGDGYDDVVLSSVWATGGGAQSGVVYVVFGKATSFGTGIELSALDGANGFKLDGEAAGDHLGWMVASAGDVNGDGFDDVIAGAYAQGGGGTKAGAAYVVFGKASGFLPAINASALDGSNGFKVTGETAGNQAGQSVAGAGDVNGDRYDDVVIGAIATGHQGSVSGSAYVIFGKASGFVSNLQLSSLGASDGFRIDGAAANDRLGHGVAGGGDLNGDGFADIILGADFNDENAAEAGATYVVFGKSAPFATVSAVSALDGTNGIRLLGVSAGDHSGLRVGNGDVNDDGLDDVLTGAYGADNNALSDSGSSYVFFGLPPDAAANRVGSAADQYITGGGDIDTLSGLDGNDRLEGRADGDTLIGGNGTDLASYAHAAGAVIASLANAAANTGDAQGDSYATIEGLEGSEFADTLTGNGAANVLRGLGGNDRLNGGNGTDLLAGGLGTDTMTGGGAKDVFAFARGNESPAGAGRDVITDFKAGTAATVIDRIDLAAIDAKSTVPGNQAFKFIGTAKFSHAAGQLRLRKVASGLIVQGDMDGNAAADFEILLKGLTATAPVTAKDFKL